MLRKPSISSLFALAATVLVDLAASQPAPGIALQADSNTLEVIYGSNTVDPAGELMPRSDLLSPPTFRLPSLPNSPPGPFILLMLDSDVPRNNSRVPLLHWLSSNVTLSTTPSNSNPASLRLPPESQQEAPYRPPNPPVGDSPHAYTFLLYASPASGFSLPASVNFSDIQQRVFSSEDALVRFLGSAGIEGAAVAANYMQVRNLSVSATGTTTFPPPRATGAAGNGTTGDESGNGGNRSVEFEGSAGRRAVVLGIGGEGAFWMGVVGMAVAVGMAAVML
ncbi:PEBP-like protein [Westerdykella ornata]|uniref:PEBP-like protein n=1 Tax=Westerdykella ornata TaxID=318751 RepID=A0A6A6J777_WESOR|nr:PEBP-like protein [Westerdykella ornata]KAF2272431.1 PEBP-like protein [Westerdykella ornata]